MSYTELYTHCCNLLLPLAPQTQEKLQVLLSVRSSPFPQTALVGCVTESRGEAKAWVLKHQLKCRVTVEHNNTYHSYCTVVISHILVTSMISWIHRCNI